MLGRCRRRRGGEHGHLTPAASAPHVSASPRFILPAPARAAPWFRSRPNPRGTQRGVPAPGRATVSSSPARARAPLGGGGEGGHTGQTRLQRGSTQRKARSPRRPQTATWLSRTPRNCDGGGWWGRRPSPRTRCRGQRPGARAERDLAGTVPTRAGAWAPRSCTPGSVSLH